jgi:predicted transcriptional regulator
MSAVDNTKALILKQIDQTPGLRYRELLRSIGLTNGALEYNLKILERTSQVKVDRQSGKRARYYSVNIPADESHILGYVRNKVARQIVLLILEHDLCTFRELVEHVSKSPSTVSGNLKRLSHAGIISVVHGQESQVYRVMNRRSVTDILRKYRESFGDKLANGYYDTFSEL